MSKWNTDYKPTLWILENNVRIKHLYDRLGFSETGRRNVIIDELDEMFVMEVHMAKDTKARILAAALELFSYNGYAGTNIRELSSSPGLVMSAM